MAPVKDDSETGIGQSANCNGKKRDEITTTRQRRTAPRLGCWLPASCRKRAGILMILFIFLILLTCRWFFQLSLIFHGGFLPPPPSTFSFTQMSFRFYCCSGFDWNWHVGGGHPRGVARYGALCVGLTWSYMLNHWPRFLPLLILVVVWLALEQQWDLSVSFDVFLLGSVRGGQRHLAVATSTVDHPPLSLGWLVSFHGELTVGFPRLLPSTRISISVNWSVKLRFNRW